MISSFTGMLKCCCTLFSSKGISEGFSDKEFKINKGGVLVSEEDEGEGEVKVVKEGEGEVKVVKEGEVKVVKEGEGEVKVVKEGEGE
ncbi:5111_t:CDS:2, partial [Diversispora eburnea]